MRKHIIKLGLTLTLVAVFVSCLAVARPAQTSYAEENEEPVMRIAMFADLHVEYGLQAEDSPSRFSTTKAVRYLRSLTGGEGVDVVLVGGDMSGGRGSWQENQIQKTITSIYQSMSYPTKDGKVLFATGNHDPEPSVKAGNLTPTTVYSGNYDDFMTDACGDYVSALYADDIEVGLSPYNELLCYRYTIQGMEFIGLNTPYLENQVKVFGLYEQQADWLENEMEKIGKEKTVFLLCHYPYKALRTVVSPNEAATTNSVYSIVNRLLNNHPNIIYTYGHVHNGDTWWAKTSARDLVKTNGGLSLAGYGAYRCTGFIECHMGSMGYYDNVYQPGGLSKDDPVVVQFVLVEVYGNRLEFQVHNTGDKYHPDGTREIAPFTIVRDLSAQLGLDPSEGVYSPQSKPSDSSSAPSSSTTDGVTDAISSTSSDTEEKSGSALPVIILCALCGLLVACVVVVLLVLKGGKKPAPAAKAPAEETPAEEAPAEEAPAEEAPAEDAPKEE